MTAALQISDNRAQAALADAVEKDNTGLEMVEANDDDEVSVDDEDDPGNTQKKQLKATKRKTWQVKALENTRKAPRSFLELLHEANLELLPPHVPSYLTAAVGPQALLPVAISAQCVDLQPVTLV